MMKKTLLASLLALSFVGSASAATVPTQANFNIIGSGTSIGPFSEKAAPPIFYYGLQTNFAGTTEIDFALDLPGAPGTYPTIQFRLYQDLDGVLDGFATNVFNLANTLQYWNVTAADPLNTLSITGAGVYVFQVLLDPTPDGSAGGVVSAVPVPAAAWLFGSALFGAGALRRKQKTA